jgi:hypothetical protein
MTGSIATDASHHLLLALREIVRQRATMGRSCSRRHCSRLPLLARRALTATLIKDNPAAVKAATTERSTHASVGLGLSQHLNFVQVQGSSFATEITPAHVASRTKDTC